MTTTHEFILELQGKLLIAYAAYIAHVADESGPVLSDSEARELAGELVARFGFLDEIGSIHRAAVQVVEDWGNRP